MKIRVLGCAGSVSPESKTSAFLINDRVLLDAGTICSSLTSEEIPYIKNVFISHPHFDHIKGVPTLAETLIFMGNTVPVTIHASEPAINSLRQHIMNDIIWPDFSRLPTEESPVIRYRSLSEGETSRVEGISITPKFLCNNQSDFGYLLDDGKSSLLYTSDIGHDAELCINGRVAESMIIEVSFPNENEELAISAGHLTPRLMMNLLNKLSNFPRNVFVAHMKAFYREKIIAELNALGLPNLKVLQDGDVLEL